MSINGNVPQIAKFLFNIYASDALEFEATVNARIIEFLPQIFPNTNSMERNRMMQILKVQILTKFCHIAENLGATALAFKSSYEDGKTEILGLFNTISHCNKYSKQTSLYCYMVYCSVGILSFFKPHFK